MPIILTGSDGTVTANAIISTALRHLRVLGAADSVDADDASVCLEAMKSLLDAWNLDPQATVGLEELTYTPGGGLQSFTIGPAGNVVASQPARIVEAFYRKSGVDYPLDVVTMEQYARAPLKTVQTEPYCVALNRGYDTAHVYVYPATDGSTEFHLWVQREVVSGWASLTTATTLSLPSGLRNALEWNLAKEVLNAFSVDQATEARVERMAQNSLRKYKKANVKVPELRMPWDPIREFDVEAGY